MKNGKLLYYYFIFYFLTSNMIFAHDKDMPCKTYSEFLENRLPEFKNKVFTMDNLLDPNYYTGKKLQYFISDLKTHYFNYNNEFFNKYLYGYEFGESDELTSFDFDVFINEQYFFRIMIKFHDSQIFRKNWVIELYKANYKQRKLLFEQIMNTTNFCIIQIKVDFIGMLNNLKNSEFKNSYKDLLKKRNEIIKLKNKDSKNKKKK